MTWTFTLIFAAIAVAVSVGLSIGVFMLVFSKRLAPDQIAFFILPLAGAVAYSLSARDLSLVDAAGLIGLDVDSSFGRFANFTCLLLCLAALIQIAMKGPANRWATLVFVAAVQYYFVCFLMPAGFDRWFVFDHKMLYPLAALLLLLAPRLSSTHALAVNMARAASATAIISLLMIVVNYRAAVLTTYDSLIPGFTGRLFGATPHANALGAICSFTILLITTYPPKWRTERYVLLLANLAALILCQSKTSWLTLLVGWTIVHLPGARRFGGRIPSFVYVLVFIALAAAPAILSVVDQSIYEYWAGNRNLAELSSLTGRTDIWHATFFLIKSHLILGPGWATYLVYMQSLFPNLVPNPHNVFLATLVQAGVVGLSALVLFVATLVIAATRLEGSDRLFMLACIVVLCVRGMSESFTLQGAFLAPTFWPLLMFLRLLCAAGPEPAPPTLAPSK